MTEKKLSAKERLAQKASTKEKKTTKKKDDFIINLSGKLSEEGDRLCAANHAKDSALTHEKRAKTVLLDPLKNLIFSEWVKEGRRLDSPTFNTLTGSHFSLQCRDSLSGERGFKLKGDQEIEDYLAEQEVPDDIIDVVKDEFVPRLTVSVDIPTLEKKNPSLAERVMELILAACSDEGVKVEDQVIKFTEEESKQIIEQVTEIKVKEGFLDRAVNKVKENSKDDEEAANNLGLLLAAVPPTWAIAQVHCADPVSAVSKLVKTPPPQDTVEEFESKDKRYKFVIENNIVSVFRSGEDRKICEKKCKDHSHAVNTVKKFQRDPSALSAFITENI